MSKLILTGGGTGGHIYPSLALLPELRARGVECVYFGGKGDTPERRAASRCNLPYYGVECVKLVRSMKPKALKNNIGIPIVLKRAVEEAERLIAPLEPDAVFSKGGFVSLPAALAAARLNIPVICHESDLTLGIANRIAKLRGATMLAANPHSNFGEFVGMPLRAELFSADRGAARRALGINRGDTALLVVGGSSGAEALNRAVGNLLPALGPGFVVIHITGDGKQAAAPRSQKYVPIDYCQDMGAVYAACDVVVSRAGATAVAELAALEKRAVFVPLPKGISRGDQIQNARLAAEYGAGVVLQEDGWEAELPNAVRAALKRPPMRPFALDANRKIADFICATMRRGGKCKDKKP